MTRNATARRRQKSRGNAFIESAFIFLVTVVMLIAIFDFAQFLFLHQALVERARYAARWGAVNGADTGSIQNMVLYNSTSGSGTGYLGLDSTMVTVTTPDSGTDNYRIKIAIANYPYVVLSPYIAGTHYGPNINVTVPLVNN